MTKYSPIILYVDDDINDRIFVAVMLRCQGFRVRTAKSVFHALQLIATENFDVMVLDYDLLEMTGAQFAQEIRALEPSARIVLFSRQACLPEGELTYVDVHMTKGSPVSELVDTISNLVSPQPSTASN
jgi:DNA-binding response OmpR family regulator